MHALLLVLAPLLGAGSAQEPAGDPAPEAERPRSFFVEPLYLTGRPPTRSARHVVVLHRDVPGAPRDVTRTEEEALELATEVAEVLREGGDFAETALRYSEGPSSRTGGVLGTFAPGMLDAPLDEFLFSAEVGELGGPFSAASGVHVLQRIETWAAARQILVAGAPARSRAECLELLARARAGEDFGALAAEHSDDETSAARRGALAIFERGPFDKLLKEAAFEAEVGEIVGPVRSPLGHHLVKRVPEDELDPTLRDRTWIRVRAILLTFEGAPDMPVFVPRTEPEAGALVHELHERVLAGEDMAELAAEYNDDLGGKERGGDLGWVHRRTPRMAPVLDRVFLVPPGTLLEPIRVPQGWALLRRES